MRSTGCDPLPSSRREALRSAAGCWAISSGGRAKSKSPRVKVRMLEGRTNPFQVRHRGLTVQNCPMSESKALSEPQKALLKLGLARDIDLALHLPLRYEDETRIVKLRDAREGDTAQIEAAVTACEIVYRPRRQLVETVDDGSDTCVLRFFSFYPSQQKALAVGNRLRLRGELKGGFLGWQMVHPTYKAAGGELPAALTPVYSTVAALPQAYVRKAVASGLARADLSETIPHDAPPAPGEATRWSLRQALAFLHHPTPEVSLATLEDRSHPAWLRL